MQSISKGHRYTRGIPEPAPFLSQHVALRVFPVIKITAVHKVRMSPASTVVCACG